MKKAWKILSAALIAVTALGLVGCKKSAQYDSYADAKLYKVGGATFTTAQVREVEIDWLGGSVEISQNVGEEIQIGEDTELSKEEERMHYYLDGDTLKIRYCASGLRVREKEKNLHVSLPKGLELDVDCTSARVGVMDALEVRAFSFESASGNLQAERIVCAGEMEIDTASGKIDVLDLTADELSVESASGDVSIEKLSVRKLEADGASGALFFGLQSPLTGEIDTSSGDVRIKLLEGIGCSVTFDSTTGKCKTERSNEKSGRTYTFAPAEGKGSCTLSVSTASGNLTVE